jgi:hypothetical protein
MRAKVCVVDWNGDGRLDLLVGDFGMTYGEELKLSEADKKTEREINAKLSDLQQKMQPFFTEYSKILQDGAKPDDLPEARKAREEKAQEVFNKKEYQKLQTEEQELAQKVRKVQRLYKFHGHVWLYLRKEVAAGR